MWQNLVKVVQVAIFFGVIGLGFHLQSIDPDAPRNGLAWGVLAVLVAFLVTVVPWLIWQGGKDIYWRIKNGPAPKDPDRIRYKDVIAWVRAGMPREQKPPRLPKP